MDERISDQIRDAELANLAQYELQAAKLGPQTPAHILVLIQELRHKYPDWKASAARIKNNAQLDFDFLMNTVAGTLQRVSRLEERITADASKRVTRQLIHDVWMIVITVMVFASMIIVLFK